MKAYCALHTGAAQSVSTCTARRPANTPCDVPLLTAARGEQAETGAHLQRVRGMDLLFCCPALCVDIPPGEKLPRQAKPRRAETHCTAKPSLAFFLS
jgi:hypothetical protein